MDKYGQIQGIFSSNTQIYTILYHFKPNKKQASKRKNLLDRKLKNSKVMASFLAKKEHRAI